VVKRVLAELKLPNPAVQADMLIVAIGDALQEQGRKQMTLDLRECSAEIGALDWEAVYQIVLDLLRSNIFEGTPNVHHTQVGFTLQGWRKYRELKEGGSALLSNRRAPTLARQPVGSPYGFNEHDWRTVEEQRRRRGVVFVVLGFQFKSKHYSAEALVRNVKAMFEQAVDSCNASDALKFKLDFRPLAAGYGEHLFNEIARDILSADIAVFETSDLNANVSLEMGVALTWGVSVLPIKAEGCPKPPSDISGQTWADYLNSAQDFVDPEHASKMLEMVRRACRKRTSASE
jgi:hypothetical protein